MTSRQTAVHAAAGLLLLWLGGCASDLSPRPASSPAAPQARLMTCVEAFTKAEKGLQAMLASLGISATSDDLAAYQTRFRAVLAPACRPLPELQVAAATHIALLTFWRGDYSIARTELRNLRESAPPDWPLFGLTAVLDICDPETDAVPFQELRSSEILGFIGQHPAERRILTGIERQASCPTLQAYVTNRLDED